MFGVRQKSRIDPLLQLDEHLALWLADMEKVLDPETVSTYTGYAKRFVAHFGASVARVTVARMGDYQRERLTCALRKTLQKEQSAMNSFLDWCEEQGVIAPDVRPKWPRLSDRSIGTRTGRQRAAPVDVTVDDVVRFLRALPIWNERRGRGEARRFAVRPRFVVAYETGLRPATLDALELGVHWSPGEQELNIPASDDKSRYGRKVPLTPLAAEALTIAADGRTKGPIFGQHDYRSAIAKAKRDAGMPANFAPYDLRHGRTGHLLDASSDMRGVAFLVGHRRLTTTDRYLRGQESRARAALLQAAPGTNCGGILGSRSASDRAKDGNRTRTGVTPLEPESSANTEIISDLPHEGAQIDPGNPAFGQHSGGAPRIDPTLLAASRYLGELRSQWDAFDAIDVASRTDEGGADD